MELSITRSTNYNDKQLLPQQDQCEHDTVPRLQTIGITHQDLRSPSSVQEFRQKCWTILENNTNQVQVNGETHTRTMPSRDFYVHQWNWDSATVPLGQVTVSPERALQELLSLTSCQWSNGMIPQISFNPHEDRYYPGEEQWHTHQQCTTGTRTSGITQPPIMGISTPVIATAILQQAVDKNQKLSLAQKKSLTQVIEGTLNFLHYIKTYRDKENSGLMTVIHPWESGLDNAPTWDEPLQAQELQLEAIPETVKENVAANRKDVTGNQSNLSQRPEQAKYFAYMNLVHQGNELNWDHQALVERSFFQVKDILFTSVFAAGCERMADFLTSDLFQNSTITLQSAQINTHKEQSQDIQSLALTLRNWANQSRDGLQRSWSDQHKGFLCQDQRQSSEDTATGHKSIEVDSISKFMPILAKAASHSQIKTLLAELNDPLSYGTTHPTPSTPLNARDKNGEPLFEMERYWRGPTWPVTNLLLIEGLGNYVDEIPECQTMIDKLKSSIINLVETVGLQEYYHPVDADTCKRAIGFGNFSWTAAIYLHITQNRETG